MRCYTVFRGRIIECEHRVRRSARFEGADLLKIFAFEKQRGASRLIQARTRQHRRPRHVRSDPLMRRANAIEIE